MSTIIVNGKQENITSTNIVIDGETFNTRDIISIDSFDNNAIIISKIRNCVWNLRSEFVTGDCDDLFQSILLSENGKINGFRCTGSSFSR
jgi:hypothetical protein